MLSYHKDSPSIQYQASGSEYPVMLHTTDMLSAIFVTYLLQVVAISCQTPASNLTHNIDITTSKDNIINNTVSNDNITLGYVNSSAELMVAEGSSVEEVLLASNPVMSDCVNGTSDTLGCMSKMLNLTVQCANETGATQDDVDIAMRMEIPSSDSGKCLTRCLLKYRGVMSPEGAFAPAATVNFLTEVHKNESLQEEFQKLADYCLGKLKLQPMSSLDTCQFAYDIATCTEEYHKTLFLRNPALAPPVNAITTP